MVRDCMPPLAFCPRSDSVRLHAHRRAPLNPRPNAWIVGMALEESDRLLDELWAHTVGDEAAVVYTHEWQRGDLLIMDNRQLIHMRERFDAESCRLLWRTQTRGAPLLPATSGDL